MLKRIFVAFMVCLAAMTCALSASAFSSEENRNCYSDYDHSTDEAVAAAMLRGEEDILPYFTTRDTTLMTRQVQYLQFTRPELFGIKDYGATTLLNKYGVHTLIGYKVFYTDNREQDALTFNARMQEVLDEVDALVPKEADDFEKAHIVHDYLVSTTAYDRARQVSEEYYRYNYDCYGVFVEHYAVCLGYSLAYKYLLNHLGITCAIASSENMNHAWNLVYINGEWYHVDVSADDPYYDMLGQVSHDYLFLSTESLLSRSPTRSDFVVIADDYELVFTDDTCCRDASHESGQYWRSSTTGCYFYDGHLYTTDGLSTIYKDGEVFFIPPIISVWHPFNISSSTYSNGGRFCRMVCYKNMAYITTPRRIYAVDLDNKKCVEWCVLDEGNKSVVGLSIIEGKLYYTVSETTPSANEEWLTLPLADKIISTGSESLILGYNTQASSIVVARLPKNSTVLIASYKANGRLHQAAMTKTAADVAVEWCESGIRVFVVDEKLSPMMNSITIKSKP